MKVSILGFDGLRQSRDDQWIYYAAMNHDSTFPVITSGLQDNNLSIDSDNNVFISDRASGSCYNDASVHIINRG
jgi:hypothetical protein